MTAGWIAATAGIAGVALIVGAVLARRRPASSFEAGHIVAQLTDLSTQLQALPSMRARLDQESELRRDVARRMEETQRGLDALRLQAEARTRREEELVAATRRIEAVFAGSAGRGRAGERALAETLRALPQEMLVRDLTLNGRVVEFALRLGDGRALPIDSKWPAAELLTRIEATDDGGREELVREIEREVGRRIREAAQYVAPGHTTPYALAAVPDAVLACCTSAYREAQVRGVLLMSYSMAVPYLLALYRLHLEYAGTMDIERARERLSEVARGIEELDALLEHRLARAATMAQNAYLEAKQVTARLRASVGNGLDRGEPIAEQVPD